MKNPDANLATRLAPRLKALHAANGGDWVAISEEAFSLIRESHRLEPLSSGEGGAETPDIPREDD
jgi:hypothetical protein